MIVSIHQPQYLPWLGYFDKIDQADIFVLLDDVQYKKNEWQNRNKIRTSQGWQWITVPVQYTFGEKINQIKTNNNTDWRENHYKSLVTNYNKASHFKNYEPFFKETYAADREYLVDINVHFIEYFTRTLGIKTKLIKSSQVKVEGQKTERLINICKNFRADAYISGAGAREYLDLDRFKKENIEVIFQNFKHPAYKQVYNNFEPFMSVVDLLFNCGDKSLEIIRENNTQICTDEDHR